jgi:predicted nucleotidyltransferase
VELPTYFKDFLSRIRPGDDEVKEYKEGHGTLRSKLLADPVLSPDIVSTFLQGSYRRSTAIQPENGKRSDVDVVIVTNFSEDEYTPADAQEKFITFLENDDEYKGRFESNDRSIGIQLDKVELDLVITSAPSEVDRDALRTATVMTEDTLEEVTDWRLVKSWVPKSNRDAGWARTFMERAAAEAEWKLQPLRIPDRNLEQWESTHPLEQIRWTSQHNRDCNTHYVNVVKALKWWRRINFSTPKYPKGYPVEHLIGTCCRPGITSVAQGVTETLEGIVNDYHLTVAALLKQTPVLPDHGVPEHNVFARVYGEDFSLFYDQVKEAAEIAREALDEDDIYLSAKGWRRLFGDRFPEADPPDDDDGDGGDRGGFTPRKNRTEITPSRFG